MSGVFRGAKRLTDQITVEREQAFRAARVTRLAVRGLAQSDLPRMAAALSYRTIFSLVPVLVVGLAVVGSFMSGEQLESALDELMDRVGLSQIVVNQPEAEAGAPVVTGGSGGEGGEGEAAVPQAAEAVEGSGDPPEDLPLADPASLETWITDIVERVQEIPLNAIGFAGLLLLVWAAISMLVELEGAFDQICAAPRRRSWARRITTYWTVLTLGAVFLFATFKGGDQIGLWVTAQVPEGPRSAWAGGAVEVAINVIINVGLLLLAYTTVPNARIKLRSALAGGLVAGVLWEVAKTLFTLYLSRGGVERLYGAMALLPLFLLWIYVTWVIVLLGLQIAYAMQHFDSFIARVDPSRNGSRARLVDPGAALLVASGVAGRFGRGGTASVGELGEELGLHEDLVDEILNALMGAGVVHRVAGGEGGSSADDEPGYTLAAPPETIEACRVLAVADGLSPVGSTEAHERVLEQLRRSRDESMGGTTLADLLADQGAATVGDGQTLSDQAVASPAT